MDLITLKNTYAQEQGYESWSEIMFLNNRNPIAVEKHMDEICIRAQKAALKKAADSSQVQHHNTRTGIKTCASGMGGNGQVYTVKRKSITNSENLIR